MKRKLWVLAVIFMAGSVRLCAQSLPGNFDSLAVNYETPKEYTIAGITVVGTEFLDKDILIALAGIRVGDRIQIPGEVISKATKNLWRQQLFANVKIYLEKTDGDNAYLLYQIEERPRLSGFTFSGTTKSEENDLREKIKLNRGKVLTDNVKVNTLNSVTGYFSEKGFRNVNVEIKEVNDTSQQNSRLYYINISKGNRVKIDAIHFTGNSAVSEKKLKSLMKKTKENSASPLSIFSLSRYKEKEFEADKNKILEYYSSKGYRDARIVSDSVYKNVKGNVNIDIVLVEGGKYYIRSINWLGNTKYTATRLDSVLRIKEGDVYDEAFLQQRLSGDPRGDDVGSLYMDDGYLFFGIVPAEVNISNDSVDLEMRVREGPQAIVNRVNIEGNSKTHEHVVRRSIRTLPGNKFSRADVIRTTRELSSLGYFDPEKMDIRTDPHPETGTVDLTYVVAEKPSDQVELSAGWGGQGTGVIGSLGVRFNNFSARGILDKESRSPLPAGDGQTFSIRFQSTGKRYQSLNFSFLEPWLGGKNPTSLSFGTYFSRYTNSLNSTDPNYGQLTTIGGSVALGKQLKWPDDYFTLISAIEVTNYNLKNYVTNFFINDGNALSISLKETFGRNSTGPDFLFPKWGSNFSLSVALTPPYSLFSSKDYAELPASEKYALVEFHKWKFLAEWYTTVTGKLVLKLAAKGGYLGYYNPDIGLPPFERFQVGGDGLSQNYSLYGLEYISQRGYEVYTPVPAPIFNKFTAELRYPFSTNPSAFIYGTMFAEAGNAWYSFDEYDPFDLNRAVGFGLRVFLPIFGTVGFDYGWPFDDPRKFVDDFDSFIGSGKFSIILGFEPE
jgi:outer membrane protein insertion porin family